MDDIQKGYAARMSAFDAAGVLAKTFTPEQRLRVQNIVDGHQCAHITIDSNDDPTGFERQGLEAIELAAADIAEAFGVTDMMIAECLPTHCS